MATTTAGTSHNKEHNCLSFTKYLKHRLFHKNQTFLFKTLLWHSSDLHYVSKKFPPLNRL